MIKKIMCAIKIKKRNESGREMNYKEMKKTIRNILPMKNTLNKNAPLKKRERDKFVT